MQSLLPLAEKIAARLIERNETIAVDRVLDRRADRGGFAQRSRRLGLLSRRRGGLYARPRARRCSASAMPRWRACGLDRSLCVADRAAGARAARRDLGPGRNRRDGPTGNRYGDAAGHTCIAVAGPIERAITLETGSADRRANMDAFAKRALELFYEVISGEDLKRTTPPLPPSRSAPRARSSSISLSPFGVCRCQKVQPLQASSPCASAPMRWIEPTLSPSDTAPSARTVALWRFLASVSSAPGDHQPALDQRRERHARRLARGHEGRDRRRGHDLHAGDALFRRLEHISFRARCR